MFGTFNKASTLYNKNNNLYNDITKKNNYKHKSYVNGNSKKFPSLKSESLRGKTVTSSSNFILPLGFTNRGLFCWLNSSLKLLFEMIDIEDILKLRNDKATRSNPHIAINKVRTYFIKLWSQYNQFNGADKNLNTEKLEQIKNYFIICLQKFSRSGDIESDGLIEYFSTSNPNRRQDTNLFIMSMERILFINNKRHCLKVSTCIDAIYNENSVNKYIFRRSSCNPALIIPIHREKVFNSINEYIKLIQNKESGIYQWSRDELLQNNIQTKNHGNTPINGNKFEIVETDFTELNSFVVYFNLEAIDPSSLDNAHDEITKILLSDNFPRDYIDVYNSHNIADKRRLSIVAKAIICFSGYGEGVHYICITIKDDKLVMHDDKQVYCIEFNDLLAKNKIPENKHIKYLMSSFLYQHRFTPYAVLYSVT